MVPLCTALLLFPFIQAGAASPNQFEILERVKLNVRAELAVSANYTCIETVERAYYAQKHACSDISRDKPKEYMRDRLRLDVAVSEGNEIFSWHGENHFVSTQISAVIPNGPRTSGQFVGFLRNIFLEPGIHFTFLGASQVNGRSVYTFNYVVQLLRSAYRIQGRQSPTLVPYHGTFTVDASTFELVHLGIVGDDIPPDSGICFAETEIDYQLANISGRQSMLPSSFILKMKSDAGIYTTSSNEYAQCRAFRGESTLHFTAVDPGAPLAARHVVDEPLSAGLTLKASLDSAVDDRNWYMGDAIDATLAESLTLPHSNKVIPKGATLHGVVSLMEQHSESLAYWLFGIKLERLTAGEDSYLLNAWPLPANYNYSGSRFNSNRVLTYEAAQAEQRGCWFMDGGHFKLAKHATRYWRTRPIPQQTEPTSQ